MNLNSKYFDRIRINPAGQPGPAAEGPGCEWKGCDCRGTHRAPKGRQREGEYFRFCIDHVREYNKSYNYFAGMADDAVSAYQKDALTGHRPTWKMGMRVGTGGRRSAAQDHAPENFADPFGMFGEMGGASRPNPEPPRESRMIRNAERRALESLGVEASATAEEIKARFKLLVKKYHPDANGGDISTEDRLRDVIQAYNHLKNAGFC